MILACEDPPGKISLPYPGGEEISNSLRYLKRPALALVFVVFILTIIFYYLKIDAAADPPYLALTLSFLFVCVSLFTITVIAARSFIKTGNWPVVWLGSGAMVYGLTMFISSWMLAVGDNANTVATVHNSGVLFSGLLHFMGAFFTINRVHAREAGRGRIYAVLGIYGVSVCFLTFVTVTGSLELLPPFFVQGTGGTTIRQIVLAQAAILFFSAGAIFLWRYRDSGSDLKYWYSLGLFLFVIGMTGIAMQESMGTPLNWTGRGAQWLGGLYLLTAALVTIHEAKLKHISPEEEISSALTRTRARLRETEERFRIVFEHAKIGILIQDVDGIVSINPALEHILGFTQQELRGRKLTDFIHPDDLGDEGDSVTELICCAPDCREIERRLIDKKGETIWTRLIGNLVIDEEGEPPFYMVLVDDISERKSAEKLKDSLIGMVSHELKNPLMAVIGSLRMAKKEGQFPEVLHELIDIASDGAESLWGILENLLELSREQAGRLKLSPVNSSLSNLIEEVIPGIRKTLIHHLTIDVPEDLPPVIVDPARVRLVLRNLLDNAVKYSPKGGNIHVFAGREGQEIVVGVKDEGIGISESNLRNLFQPFERLGADSMAGTGLGLVICRRLVEAHKGRIWVESEPGKGSTLYFSLPAAPQETQG